MITIGELTLNSGFKYTIEIHEVEIFQMSILHGGSFKVTEEISSQLNKDAHEAGSWQAIQEMNIKFSHRGNEYDADIIVKDILSDYPKFKIIKIHSM
ncbi:hypothetical protein [Pseudoalteromonas sp. Z1A6]|uniref:hypothetical protein n=1 Tax=Pseudoalteromonas sp. Z1A6 TaxID=2686349 RepID=UPI0013FDD371|nr:hypothetical protein [Pseudoalteromonas sp. Z1A6]